MSSSWADCAESGWKRSPPDRSRPAQKESPLPVSATTQTLSSRAAVFHRADHAPGQLVAERVLLLRPVQRDGPHVAGVGHLHQLGHVVLLARRFASGLRQSRRFVMARPEAGRTCSRQPAGQRAALTKAGFSCAIQWPVWVTASVRFEQACPHRFGQARVARLADPVVGARAGTAPAGRCARRSSPPRRRRCCARRSCTSCPARRSRCASARRRRRVKSCLGEHALVAGQVGRAGQGAEPAAVLAHAAVIAGWPSPAALPARNSAFTVASMSCLEAAARLLEALLVEQHGSPTGRPGYSASG